MATGWVRAGFLYIRTRPAGLTPKPEPAPFNKRVFFNPNPPRRVPSGPAGSASHFRALNWPYNLYKKKKKTFPFKHRITQTQTHRFETQSYKKKKRVFFQTQNHKSDSQNHKHKLTDLRIENWERTWTQNKNEPKNKNWRTRSTKALSPMIGGGFSHQFHL